MFRPCIRSLNNVKARNTPSYRKFTSRVKINNNDSVWTKRTAARVTVLTASSLLLASTVFADNNVETSKESSLGSSIRAYTVYTMCAIPALVDASPRLLSLMSSIPGLKQITEAFVRITFFDQFVGADSATEALPLLRSLRSANKGVLFAYSVEVDENEATGASISLPCTDGTHNSANHPSHSTGDDDNNNNSHLNVSTAIPPYQRIVDEMLHCIDVAADFEEGLMSKSSDSLSVKGRRTWVAIKMTALLPDAHDLIALSSSIVESRKDPRTPVQNAAIPFPGSARIEDLDVILKTPPAGYSALTPAQISGIRELYNNLRRICTRAQERGIKLIVDAEYSWYQPAIDALTLALMREFNSLDAKKNRGQVQPLVYGTFQAYLRRTPGQLALALADARANNYALGVKLVRGAYHPHEIAAHTAAAAYDKAATSGNSAIATVRPLLSISPDLEPPVWMEKRETDEAYNGCLKVLIKEVKEDVKRCEKATGHSVVEGITEAGKKNRWFGLFSGSTDPIENGRAVEVDKKGKTTTTLPPRIGVLFGTHNWNSCGLVLKSLVDAGLAVTSDGQDSKSEAGELVGVVNISDEAVERIAIGQLYGMCDDLTDWVVKHTVSNAPFVIKYVPYGALAEVLPYLSRRAIENKSVLGDGAASRERQRAGREIWKRIVG
ncbi:FAD-linked oxidoreductase [Phlegmacium glaucopus]|nr:FAD-linked oxidoreductase [Phlegmacium glaucopus]